jgi:hypothetical protein
MPWQFGWVGLMQTAPLPLRPFAVVLVRNSADRSRLKPPAL